jgi:hypothetical protein
LGGMGVQEEGGIWHNVVDQYVHKWAGEWDEWILGG